MNIFNDLIYYKVDYGFFNDPNVSFHLNYEYINQRYYPLIKFITEDLNYVQMKFKKLDLLVNNCT